jgi:Thermopsin
MARVRAVAFVAVFVAVVMLGSILLGISSGPFSAAGVSAVSTPAPTSTMVSQSTVTAPSGSPVSGCSPATPATGSPFLTLNGDGYVNGRLVPGGNHPGQACIGNNTDPAPAPSGVAYDGQSDVAGVGIKDNTIDSNSVEGIQTVNSTTVLYPDDLTPARWGDQLNVVLTNITILGQKCAKPNVNNVCTSPYSFWVQSLAEYDTSNQTLSFYDATWNFTGGSSLMYNSSLVSWSPNSSNYTGIWLLAHTPYIHAPLPFTLSLYVNSTVNAAGDQVLWYNYTVLTNGQFYGNGNYDYLVINSQRPGGPIAPLAPAPFEASATTRHEVDEGYEFDTMIGPDTSSNMINFVANETVQVKYCSLPPSNDCTPGDFSYANVPAAVNYGSQTAEGSIGLSINYEGATAYVSAGPFIEHGLWNYTGQTGSVSGFTPVVNNISVSGSPLSLSSQPYVFVFFESTSYASQGYQWAADVPTWYLMPGTYNYELMLADYQEQTGTIVVGSSTVTLTAVLPYSLNSGVYTPLWAFNNGQLAGISQSGNGTISNQYVLFNNPTTATCTFCGGVTKANNLSSTFYLSKNSYTSYAGIILYGTHAYVNVNSPPSFCVRTSGTSCSDYLSIWFYQTSNVTLSHGAAIRGWPSPEWDFYIDIPGSQNMFAQGDVDVLSSTHDLIMSNTFESPKSTDAPASLVLAGGSNNTVWGNTFRDPPGVAMGVTYGGLGEDEGGDLIYNNNFSVDNPVVLLPYNMSNDAECLPQCSAATGSVHYYNSGLNTWNITPQPASNVHMVNGFALSGNIMGPSYTVTGGPNAPTQGGNYFWNYGTSPNNRSVPYVSRFLYTDLSQIYPLGCPSIQVHGQPCGTAPKVVGGYVNGMPNGTADFAPIVQYSSYTVTFTESGLPVGATWYVNVTGEPSLSATGASTSLTLSLGNATYDFTVATNDNNYAPNYYQGSVTVAGAAVSAAPIAFTLVTYPVQFSETGLPAGTSWTATLGGNPQSSTSSSITFNVINGSYAYSIASGNSHYAPNVYSGSVLISGAGQSVPITFSSVTYAVTFSESGLPSGDTWYVNITSGPSLSATGATTTVGTSLPNGTYSYSVATNDATYAPNYYSGTVTVNGAAASGAAITFSVVDYAVTFTETGLPSHTSWSVTLNAATQTSTGTSLVFDEVNGTYGYSLSTALGGTFTGTTTVNGASVGVTAAFHSVKFVESGLPAGTTWQVTTNGVTLSSATTTIQFYLVDGHTYAYAVGLISGYHTTDHGSLTLVGTAISVNVPFKLTTYSVKFTEGGFTVAWKTTWCVTFGATTTCATGATSITFSGIVNGTYSYTIGQVANYTLNGGAYTGSSVVSGAGQGQTAVTVATHWTLVKYTVKFSETGLAHGSSWQVTVDGVTKVTTAATMSFTLSNGTYSFTAIASGYSSVTGSLTVNGAKVTQSVTFTPHAGPIGADTPVRRE